MTKPVCQYLLLSLLLSVVPSFSLANEPADIHRPDSTVATQAPSEPGLTRSIASYETRIAELEAAAGPHAAGLVEARSSLGMLYQQAGDHGQAIAVLRDACSRCASTRGCTA